ncbi:hypothetical protein R3P38DRAFT_3530651 [Favolaschia claudopus]|uniref:Uncharacterized protein n=1 Tax=Favolaschia claudopus TaxID=2862362 RepID=A0AAW0BIW0_9AGAR
MHDAAGLYGICRHSVAPTLKAFKSATTRPQSQERNAPIDNLLPPRAHLARTRPVITPSRLVPATGLFVFLVLVVIPAVGLVVLPMLVLSACSEFGFLSSSFNLTRFGLVSDIGDDPEIKHRDGRDIHLTVSLHLDLLWRRNAPPGVRRINSWTLPLAAYGLHLAWSARSSKKRRSHASIIYQHSCLQRGALSFGWNLFFLASSSLLCEVDGLDAKYPHMHDTTLLQKLKLGTPHLAAAVLAVCTDVMITNLFVLGDPAPQLQ